MFVIVQPSFPGSAVRVRCQAAACTVSLSYTLW